VFGAPLAIALVVGLLIALAPLITPWGALALGLALALMAALSLLVARHAFNDARDLLLGQRNATRTIWTPPGRRLANEHRANPARSRSRTARACKACVTK
jgi:hypothetical protein